MEPATGAPYFNFVKCFLKPDGRWITVPGLLCEMLGYSEDELARISFPDIIHQDDRAKVPLFSGNFKDGEFTEFEDTIGLISKSGDTVKVQFSAILMRDRDGNPEKFVCHIQNLTELHKMHRKSESTRQQFESIFNNNPLPVYRFDLEGRFTDVNDKLVEFTGYSREQLLGVHYKSFILNEDLERTDKQFKKAVNGTASQYKIRVKIRDSIKHIHVTNFPVYSGNEVTGVYGIFEDITEQLAATRDLQQSEQRFKSLFEHNPDAVYSFDTEGNFVLANKALEELTGYSIEELKKINFEPLTAPEDREKVWKKFQETLQGKPQTYEASGIHKSGEKFYIQITNLPTYIDEEITGIFGIAHNITDKKRAQQKIKENEERWQQLVEQNPQPVQIVQDGKIVFINQAGARFYGASSPGELNGKPITDFTHPDYQDKILARKNELEQNKEIEPGYHKVITLDGKERHIEAHSIPIQYNGKIAIQTVVHDISALKEKQQFFEKSLKEKKVLLQEIHHRVKNNLAVISSLLQLQAMNITDEKTIQALQDSQLRVQSMAMIHQKLYQTESLHKIGFNTYLEDLIENIISTYGATRSEVETSYDLDELFLEVKQGIPCSLIVNEVIVNCFKHAFEKNSSGEIHISLKSDNPTILLTISDNGSGLPDDFRINNLQSLGMTLIKTLVRQLKGEFSFTNQASGNGTIFSLKFDKQSSP